MWSPQQYLENGDNIGVDRDITQHASKIIEDFLCSHPDLPPILTLGHLAKRTGISWHYLHQIVMGSRAGSYRFFRIRKRSGGFRQISVPEAKLMAIQRWISAYILSKLRVHRASFAFSPKSSIKRCAEQHCEARWLIKLDINGFFGSISEIKVYRIFLEIGYAPLVALELTRLCTHAPSGSKRYRKSNKISCEWLSTKKMHHFYAYSRRGTGFLPQGAPTSPMLSNLVMKDIDKKISSLATNARLTYTRYSDDITLSTKSSFDRRRAKVLIREITDCLRQYGFSINNRKTRIVPPGARKVVLGLLVDGSEPRLSREFRDNLRQHIYYLQKFGPEAHRKARKFDTISSMYRHIHGLLDFAKSVDLEFASKMQTQFDNVTWSVDISLPNVS